MKTQIIHTPDRLIVKIPADLSEPMRALRRAEKRLGVTLVKLTDQVHPMLIFSDRGSWPIVEKRRLRFSFQTHEKARILQSKAAKHARSFVDQDRPGGWSEAVKTSPQARLAARYALNPSACTLAPIPPRLP